MSRINGDFYVNGTLSAKTMVVANNSVTNASIASNAAIAYTKFDQPRCIQYAQQNGTNTAVFDTDVPVFIASGTGKVLEFSACVVTPPAGDTVHSIDLELGNASNPYATILSSPITINNATAARTVVSATISADDIVADDQLRVTVNSTGTGTAAASLLVQTKLWESPA